MGGWISRVYMLCSFNDVCRVNIQQHAFNNFFIKMFLFLKCTVPSNRAFVIMPFPGEDPEGVVEGGTHTGGGGDFGSISRIC